MKNLTKLLGKSINFNLEPILSTVCLDFYVLVKAVVVASYTLYLKQVFIIPRPTVHLYLCRRFLKYNDYMFLLQCYLPLTNDGNDTNKFVMF